MSRVGTRRAVRRRVERNLRAQVIAAYGTRILGDLSPARAYAAAQAARFALPIRKDIP